ncbi:MAG: endonuclease [Bacteroidales bacterium]|nr:endonuclease [Bacteroidales bacterium]
MMKKMFFLQMTLLALYVGAQPVGYYNGTEGLRGNALKMKLNEVISGHYFYQSTTSGVSNVWFSNRNHSYFNAKLVFLESDADPDKPGNVIDLYRGLSYDGDNYGVAAGTLNREHIWAKSHGNFPDNSAMYCDYHNLRPSEARINQAKGNKDFDWATGGQEYENSGCYFTSNAWEPRTPVKGDVGRTLFYMDTRYMGATGEINLEVVNSLGTYPAPKHGKLDAVYEWNTLDLPDFFEVNRNEVIYKYQGNRNPYIDNPYWVEMIWGDRPPATVLIGSMTQTPIIATDSNPVEISAKITNAPNISSVQLAWGFSFDDLENSVKMELKGGRWLAQIPTQPQNTRIYLCVVVNSNGTRTESIRYSYYVYGTMPIAKVQGTGNHSPYENQQVTVTGIVTASYSDGYYIQDDTNTRSGIYVYDANRKTMIGNVVRVTGTVADHYGLTQINSLTSYKLLQIRYPVPEPAVINTGNLSKNHQSMFVKLNDVVCTTLPDGNGDWTVFDNYGNVLIHNSTTFSFSPTVNHRYDIQGILTYYNEAWRIELRQLGDVKTASAISPTDTTADKMQLFPNPADNHLTIQLKADFPVQTGTLKIFSIDGKLHHSEDIILQKLETGHRINLDALPSGLWILSLKYSENTINKVFIIK